MNNENINPFKVFGIEYNGTETEGLDEKIQKKYEETVATCNKIEKESKAKYPNLPDSIEDLEKEINLVEHLRENGEKISFSVFTENDEKVFRENEKKCNNLQEIINLLIESKKQLNHINIAFPKINTLTARLSYLYNSQKAPAEMPSDLIKSVKYRKTEEMSFVDLDNFRIKPVGKIEYKNWTGVYNASIDTYLVKDNSNENNFVFTDIRKEYFNDPNFISFLNRTLFNEEYVEYAIANHNGYLGSPQKNDDGSYKIEFDYEDMAALEKHEKMLHENLFLSDRTRDLEK